jgi:hypothetical protein
LNAPYACSLSLSEIWASPDLGAAVNHIQDSSRVGIMTPVLIPTDPNETIAHLPSVNVPSKQHVTIGR